MKCKTSTISSVSFKCAIVAKLYAYNLTLAHGKFAFIEVTNRMQFSATVKSCQIRCID